MTYYQTIPNHPYRPLSEHGQTLEDAAAMRRIAREIDALGKRHPVTTGALLLRIRADQIDPAHAESA